MSLAFAKSRGLLSTSNPSPARSLGPAPKKLKRKTFLRVIVETSSLHYGVHIKVLEQWMGMQHWPLYNIMDGGNMTTILSVARIADGLRLPPEFIFSCMFYDLVPEKARNLGFSHQHVASITSRLLSGEPAAIVFQAGTSVEFRMVDHVFAQRARTPSGSSEGASETP